MGFSRLNSRYYFNMTECVELRKGSVGTKIRKTGLPHEAFGNSKLWADLFRLGPKATKLSATQLVLSPEISNELAVGTESSIQLGSSVLRPPLPRNLLWYSFLKMISTLSHSNLVLLTHVWNSRSAILCPHRKLLPPMGRTEQNYEPIRCSCIVDKLY
jgi:hypothetical protein